MLQTNLSPLQKIGLMDKSNANFDTFCPNRRKAVKES